mmetsp:Transcript_27418/g.38762  ORF Transcript_27418/g.38762 Transcript_27418/m.38762 type:complete len:84 (-) Transcript_27418:167-418(-)
MIADVSTKLLQGSKFRKFRNSFLSLEDWSTKRRSQECVGDHGMRRSVVNTTAITKYEDDHEWTFDWRNNIKRILTGYFIQLDL